MKERHLKPLLGLLAAVVVAALGACSSQDITGVRIPDSAARTDSASRLLGFGPRLIYCPTTQTASTSDAIGPLGGQLSVAGTVVSVPVGALLEPVTMTLTVPASNYMEIDVSVQGATSFLFQTLITVSLDYSRCTSWRARFFPVTVYHIDSETKDLLEAMPTIDNKLTRTAIFTTGHLSGYALAN